MQAAKLFYLQDPSLSAILKVQLQIELNYVAMNTMQICVIFYIGNVL